MRTSHKHTHILLAFGLALLAAGSLASSRSWRASLAASVAKFAPQPVAALIAPSPQPAWQRSAEPAATTNTSAASTAPAQNQPPELFSNPASFERLSSAAQNRFVVLYGKDGKPGPIQQGIPSGSAPIVPPDKLSALANPLVNNPAADLTSQKTQSETTLVLGSGSNIIAGFNDSGSFLGGAQKFTGAARSTNSGTSFTDIGTLPTNAAGDAGDPVLARNNTTGRIYLATLSFIDGAGIRVFRSDDDGATYQAPVNGAPGVAATDFVDKEWITVDNFSGSGNGNVYLVGRNFVNPVGGGIIFWRSTDNGNTFGPSGGTLIKAEGAFNVQGAFVAVGPDHAVYVFWLDQSAGSATPNILKMRKSTDQGVTFAPEVNIATLNTTGTNGSQGSVGGFRTNSFAQVVVNPTNASHLIITYNDIVGPNATAVDRGDIFLRQSIDGGATWGAATRVNTDTGTTLNWSPAIAITPNGQNVMLTWYDRRSDPNPTENSRRIETWGRIATVSGTTLTFGPDFVVSNASFPAVFGQDPVVNAVYMGDYDQVVADNSFFYTTWGDNRLGDPDVRFARIPVAGPGPIIGGPVATIAGGDGDGQIEADECNDLTVRLTNNGTATATGITATLSTTTPGVSIANATQSYPNLAVGQSATNATPFRISTSPAFVCGIPIDLTLVINYTGGPDTVTFSLASALPNVANYTFTTSTGQAIVPGTTLVTGTSADDAAINVTLPFSYTIYGQTFTTARLGTNGNIQFLTSSTDFSNTCPLPGTATDNLGMAIMPHWDDLNLSGTGNGIFTSVSGTAPNRIFNVEWRGVLFGTTNTVSFEARLFEGQQRFDFVYGSVSGNGAAASIGVQRANAPTTFFTQFSCNTASLSSGLAVSFTAPPATCPVGNGACDVTVITNPSSSLSEPAACTGAGNVVNGTVKLNNATSITRTITATISMPSQLLALPGSCTASIGDCMVVNSSTITYTGDVPAGQTVTIRYQAQVNDTAVSGTNACVVTTAQSGGAAVTTTACLPINCAPLGPGTTIPSIAPGDGAAPPSDQKPGSVLFYNLYTSATDSNRENTRISMTNVEPSRPAFIHIFFVDGATCATADAFICLTPQQTVSFLASDLDPGTTGYILAVAVDRNGCPINFNYLIGDEYVKLSSGHQANLAAESIPAIVGGVTPCTESEVELRFDGVYYAPVPRVLALDNVGSRADGNDTVVIINRVGGDLLTSADTLKNIFGIMYDDAENALSFAFNPQTCQFRATVGNNFPRTTPRFEQAVPAGRTAWFKFYGTTDQGMFGAAINFNANASASAGAYNGGHNLHKLTFTTGVSYTIPVLPVSCQ